MIKAAIERILALSPPNITQSSGFEFTDKPVTLIKPPLAVPLETDSLSSLIQYIKGNIDGTPKGLFIHVVSPRNVQILLPLNDTRQREILVSATHPDEFQTRIFGDYFDIEQFIIKMKTRFVETDASLNVIKLVGNIRDEKVAKVSDDGISQKVTTSTGVASITDMVIPNPVILKPYRTFFEIEQPASPFLLRMKQGQAGQMPSCALFEADGGMWEKEAMSSIREYLGLELPGIVILS